VIVVEVTAGGSLESRLKVAEKLCKTALSKTGVSIHILVGRTAASVAMPTSCAASWGSFVEAKVNLLDVVGKELHRRTGGKIWLSNVCDPHQPPEKKYKLSRGVIELLTRLLPSLSVLRAKPVHSWWLCFSFRPF